MTKYLVKIYLSVGSELINLDDHKSYFDKVKIADSFNSSVLVDQFSYNKLTLNVTTCKLKYYTRFYKDHKVHQMLDLLATIYKGNDRVIKSVLILVSDYYSSLGKYQEATIFIERAKQMADKENNNNCV